MGIVEVQVARARAQSSNVLPLDEDLVALGVVQPPHDLKALTDIFEASSSLRPNVEAYATNIDGFEHSFEPVVDIDGDGARDFFRAMLKLEKSSRGEFPLVDDAEVDAAIFEARHVMPEEELMLKAFFASCCEDSSWKTLRERTRTDLEVTGNGYTEVMRNAFGRPHRFAHVQSHVMRITNAGPRMKAPGIVRTSEIGLARHETTRRFRRYVQLLGGMERVWFKQFGDPRTMSSATGAFYASEEDLGRAEEGVAPATEIIHWSIYASSSIYGVPRWIGATAAVLGTRASEEINFAYFGDKCIPPLAIIVDDGKLAEGALDRIHDILENEIKGQRNFHKALLLQGVPQSVSDGAGGTRISSPKIRIEPLAQYQQSDALFQGYEQNNAEKVGQQFRLPRLLRGLMTDFNRATADAALDYANTQVFQPLRTDFDETINRLILAELGVRFWRFKSGAATVQDPELLSRMINGTVDAQILVPREGRELAAKVFGKKFPPIDAEWADQPTAKLKGSDAGKAVKQLVDLRADLEATEQSRASRSHAAETRTITLPAAEFAALVRPH